MTRYDKLSFKTSKPKWVPFCQQIFVATTPNLPSKVEWDLTNGPLNTLLDIRYPGLGVRSVDPGDLFEILKSSFFQQKICS